MSAAELEEIRDHAEAMADEGLRILAVARAEFRNDELPDDPHAFQFRLLGLVGLADPIRPEVPAAIQECDTAGIRVVMITGDFAGTARSIARQAGLKRIRAGRSPAPSWKKWTTPNSSPPSRR